MASPKVVKAILSLATDKRVWTAIGSIICGVILMVVGVVAAFLNIFSYDDSASITASESYRQFIGEIKSCYRKIDANVNDKCPDLDKDQIHAVFYTLYFGEEKNMPDSFYSDFVECFIDRTTNDEGEETVSPCSMDTALDRLQAVTGIMMTATTKQQVNELYSVLRYGISNAGNDGVQYNSLPPASYSDATFAKLMGEATKYIGFPYVWGGSSPSTSFDCSGFVCWSYTHSGVYNLPRTTAQGIYDQCAKVSRAEARPGDLVFFTRTYVTNEAVTHIGIFVGDGLMLHCGNVRPDRAKVEVDERRTE